MKLRKHSPPASLTSVSEELLPSETEYSSGTAAASSISAKSSRTSAASTTIRAARAANTSSGHHVEVTATVTAAA